VDLPTGTFAPFGDGASGGVFVAATNDPSWWIETDVDEMVADEVAASGAFMAALLRLHDSLPTSRATEVDALMASESFVEATRVEGPWMRSITAAGPDFDAVAASAEAVDAIGRLYEARVNSLLDLYAYGERFLDEQAQLAGDLRAQKTHSERNALIWIWVSAGGSVALLGLVLTSTLLPLRALDRHTRLVREGDLAINPTRPSGPSEVRSLTNTFNDMVVTLRAFDAQVGRLARGDTAIDESLPGPLGATMRESVGRLAEVTERLHHSEAAAQQQARTDPLTGLANRTAVIERLDEIGASALATGRAGAIIFIDLDGFKNVNDTHGHAAGDRILRDIGDRLRRACPNDDVARIGGDEFIVLVEDAVGIQRVEAFAARLIKLVEEPCEVREGHVFSLTASAGITLCDGSCSALESVARADSAVYHAKEQGRSRVESFDERLAAEIEAHSEMALSLRRALDDGEFGLVFQPIIDLPTGRPIGVEALLRWTLPDGREIGPAEFIPVAERTGMIAAIDDWVIDHALEVRRRWAADPVTREVRVAVNISGRHLGDASLPRRLAERCTAFGVEPSSMGVEITETYLMENAPRSRLVVDALRDLGIGVAIDDFGTGYSSMSSLHELDADTIKIDKTFVAGLTGSTTDRTIVELVLRLADSLGMAVIAEGVDSEEKLAHLVRLGCRYAQGFLLAIPMDVDSCTSWLHDRLAASFIC
jgi:diguanylate cyclase (GGDEF)-like protein